MPDPCVGNQSSFPLINLVVCDANEFSRWESVFIPLDKLDGTRRRHWTVLGISLHSP